MKVILFGASGMVGQGVLRECLLDSEIDTVLLVNRSSLGEKNPKIVELVQSDVGDLDGSRVPLHEYDACFFCIGVSSVGMKEAEYRRVTHDLTLRVAGILAGLNPGMTFIYVTGAGTDSSEKGTVMWARVKGETENALFRLPFESAYMFRPGVIQPLHGIKSKTKLYRLVYPLIGPLITVARKLAPDHVTTTEQIGLAMIALAKGTESKTVLEVPDINRL